MKTVDWQMEGRLHSIDALRGFDMLMIVGLGAVIVRFCIVMGWGSECALALQFKHVEWNGLRFEDTIFPLFLFVAGASWPFSCARQVEKGCSRGQMALRCIKRGAILFLLGLAYNGLLVGQLRMGSVLGRIGVSWCVCACLWLYTSWRTSAVFALAFPIGYWALLYFFPAPDAQTLVVPESLRYVFDYGTGPFSIVGNLSGWFDRHLMPGVLVPYAGIADNQSALGYIPALGTVLLGMLSGDFLRRTRVTLSNGHRLSIMFAAAVGLALLGLLIGYGCGPLSMPINKKLWSASFTFVVGGYSVAMLAIFHLLVDICGCVRLAFPLQVVGVNAITIYLLNRFLPLNVLAHNLSDFAVLRLSPVGGDFVIAIMELALSWLLLYFLYRKGIFLKV